MFKFTTISLKRKLRNAYSNKLIDIFSGEHYKRWVVNTFDNRNDLNTDLIDKALDTINEGSKLISCSRSEKTVTC